MDDLAVFLAVRRAGGFRTAAKWLNFSPSTVSDTISRLEAHLGTPLFVRTTRSVQLTEAGRLLGERIEPVLSEARAALDEVASARGEVRGRIKLNVPGAVMVDILPPILDGFLVRHPGVRFEIIVDDRLVDITAAGCDAGIRYGEHLAQDMIAVPIGPARQSASLAAAPDYLARRGVPEHPRALMEHDCLRFRFASGALGEWEFEREGEILVVDPPAKIVVGTPGASGLIDLAIAGQGIVYTFHNWLQPHLQRGSLVPILPDWWIGFEGPRLYFSSRLMPVALRAFVDYVSEARGSASAAGGG